MASSSPGARTTSLRSTSGSFTKLSPNSPCIPNVNDTTLRRNALCSCINSRNRRRNPSADAWSTPTTSITISGGNLCSLAHINTTTGEPANSVSTSPERRQSMVSSTPTSTETYWRAASPGPCHEPVISPASDTPPQLPISLCRPITSKRSVAAAYALSASCTLTRSITGTDIDVLDTSLPTPSRYSKSRAVSGEPRGGSTRSAIDASCTTALTNASASSRDNSVIHEEYDFSRSATTEHTGHAVARQHT
jgi:hypothetical protein